MSSADMALDPPWRPSVEDVAALLRARTKDPSGHELGTFTDKTRPTDVEVEKLISNGCAKVATRVGWTLPDDAWQEAGHLASIWAAYETELSYWPEQWSSGRSAAEQYFAAFNQNIDAFADFVATYADPGTVGSRQGTITAVSGTVAFAYTTGYGLAGPLSDLVNVGSGGNQ